MTRIGRTLTRALLGVALCAAPAVAQHLPTFPTATLAAEVALDENQAHLRVEVDGASGSAFLWQVGPNPDDGLWWNVSISPLTGGAGKASLTLEAQAWAEVNPLKTRAVFLVEDVLMQSPLGPLAATLEEPLGDAWDFDWGSGAIPLVAGTVVSQTQPWAEFATISAVNANPAHPSEVVLLDSAQPSAGDLATPGGGLGNFEAQGQLLVIAANVDDANKDDLVDVPEVESEGGVIVFDLAGYSTVFSLQVVDVDEPGGEVRFLRDGEVVQVEPLFPVGDNSLYTTGGEFSVNRIEVDLKGTAGIARMAINPCETVVDFDVSPTGVPWNLSAGQYMSGAQAPDVLGGILIFFLAFNGSEGHPNEVVLFDTQAPTGGDVDLATPGPGIGNDEALGKVLIIAENDFDGDGDLLVDEPDDESHGGVISIGYITSCGRFRGATVVDIDEDEYAWVEVFLETGGSVVIPFERLGDNSVQSIEADVGPTRRIDFHFSGSAGLAEIRLCPEPNF